MKKIKKILTTLVVILFFVTGCTSKSIASNSDILKRLNEEECFLIKEVDFNKIQKGELYNLLNEYNSPNLELAIASLATDDNQLLHEWLLEKEGINKETLIYILENPRLKNIKYYKVTRAIHERIIENEYTKEELDKLIQLGSNHTILDALLDNSTLSLDDKLEVFKKMKKENYSMDSSIVSKRFKENVLMKMKSDEQEKILKFILEELNYISYIHDFLSMNLDESVFLEVVKTDSFDTNYGILRRDFVKIAKSRITDRDFYFSLKKTIESLNEESKKRTLISLLLNLNQEYEKEFNKNI